MGRMLDALRRIDGECRVPRTGDRTPVAARPSPRNDGRAASSVDAEANSPAGLPQGKSAEVVGCHSAAVQAAPAASRWWKTPLQSGLVQGGNAGSPQESQPAISDVVTHLIEEFPSGRSAVLLLCDPEPVDVAPAVAALSVALASQVTGQLLAVDATLCDTRLTSLLKAEPDTSDDSRPGLTDVLAGTATWQQAVRGTRLPNLEMLSGKTEETGSDRPSFPTPDDRWAAALRRLRQQYQFVLIGISPSNNPAVTAVARAADAIYLVLRPGHTGQRAARQAARTLRRCGGRVLGSILIQHSGPG